MTKLEELKVGVMLFGFILVSLAIPVAAVLLDYLSEWWRRR